MDRKQKLSFLRKAWPELIEADKLLNIGLEIELISAIVYAENDGMPVEEYIMRLLREERVRRQRLDSISSSNQMIDNLIAEAQNARMGLLDYVAERFVDSVNVKEIRPDFLVKIIRRLEERAKG